MKIVNGVAMPDADEFMTGRLSKDGDYQRHHLDAAMKYVRDWKVAIDGGAHVGTWTKVLAQKFGAVVSFEPAADTFECLQHNCSALSNVELRQQALGRKPGRVRMTLDGFERAILLKNTGARFVADGTDVERITIDSLDLETLDFLKLDVEGSEVDALMGAEETLLAYRPVVLFEDKGFWKRYRYRRHEPHDYLASLGARHLERIQMDEIWGW